MDSQKDKEVHDICHKCGSVSGVYLQVCDACMTRFNRLDASRSAADNFCQFCIEWTQDCEGGPMCTSHDPPNDCEFWQKRQDTA